MLFGDDTGGVITEEYGHPSCRMTDCIISHETGRPAQLDSEPAIDGLDDLALRHFDITTQTQLPHPDSANVALTGADRHGLSVSYGQPQRGMEAERYIALV